MDKDLIERTIKDARESYFVALCIFSVVMYIMAFSFPSLICGFLGTLGLVIAWFVLPKE